VKGCFTGPVCGLWQDFNKSTVVSLTSLPGGVWQAGISMLYVVTMRTLSGDSSSSVVRNDARLSRSCTRYNAKLAIAATKPKVRLQQLDDWKGARLSAPSTSWFSKKLLEWRPWILIAASLLAFSSRAAAAEGCASKANLQIVLDVGHTATDGGAPSARGVREYIFNLKLAQRIKEELVKAGFNSVFLMVTHENGTRGLFQRVKRANAMNASIFISIHHDSVADAYLQPWLYQGKEYLYSDRSKGFSLHVSPNNRKYGDSLHLAENMADSLISRGLGPTTNPELCMPKGAKALEPARGIYQRRNLAVLDFTKMTAILLEAGMIVNREEELAALSEDRHELIASAIVECLTKLCGGHEIVAGQ
jgi:N-acetylmuramoyl-L-alanine amidase